MAGRIGIDDEGGTRLLYRIGQDNRTKFDRQKTRCVEVRDCQVKMKLLRVAVWPLRTGVGRCALERQLESRPIGVHLTPLRITDIQLTIQKVCVKPRKT